MSTETQTHQFNVGCYEQSEQERDEMSFIYDQFMNLGQQREVLRQMRETLDKLKAITNEIKQVGNRPAEAESTVSTNGDNSVRDMPSGLSARLCSSSETPVHQD